MKIVFFTDFYFPDLNGVSAAVELSAQGLRDLGHRVYIVAPAAAKPTPNDHPDVIRLPSTPGVWYKEMRDGIMTPKYATKIKALDADIYHIHTNGVTGLSAMRLMFSLDMPAVAHYHTDYEEYSKIYRGMWAGILTASLFGPLFVGQQKAWPESLQGIRPKKSFKEWNDNMVRNLIRLSYIYFGQIIVPSQKMKDKLISYGVNRPIAVLPTGLNPEEFQILEQPSKQGGFSLLYIGRVSKEKNIDVLIDAAKILAHKGIDFHLKIVGPGPYYLTKVKQRVKNEGLEKFVSLTGGLPREKALAQYLQADAFLFPSMTDTQALVLNEAAYAGLPLVYSDPEISQIAKDGETGIIAKPTGASYADAIEFLMANPQKAKECGKKGNSLASKLTIDNQAKALEKLYKNTIKQHTPYENSF